MPSLIERAELPVEFNKKIHYDRPWTTLFCPITKDKKKIFTNLYVDPASLDDKNPSLRCATPRNDKSFYTENMKRM